MAKRALLILTCILVATACEAANPRKKPALAANHAGVTNFARDIQPILSQYCYGCHGDTKKKADLSLQEYRTEGQVIQDRRVWEKVLHHVRGREMPPENKPQPSLAQRDLIVAWIETKIFP